MALINLNRTSRQVALLDRLVDDLCVRSRRVGSRPEPTDLALMLT